MPSPDFPHESADRVRHLRIVSNRDGKDRDEQDLTYGAEAVEPAAPAVLESRTGADAEETEANSRRDRQRARLPEILDALNLLRKDLTSPDKSEAAAAKLTSKINEWLKSLNGVDVDEAVVAESWGKAAEVVLEPELLETVDGKDLVRQLNLAQAELNQMRTDDEAEETTRAKLAAM